MTGFFGNLARELEADYSEQITLFRFSAARQGLRACSSSTARPRVMSSMQLAA
jgi:hypothetical protein